MDSHGAAQASGTFLTDSAASTLRGPSQNGAAEARDLRTRSRGMGSGMLAHAAQLGAALLHQVTPRLGFHVSHVRCSHRSTMDSFLA